MSWRRSRRSSATPDQLRVQRARDFKTAFLVEGITFFFMLVIVTVLTLWSGHYVLGFALFVLMMINGRANDAQLDVLQEDMDAWVAELAEAIEENKCPNNSSRSK